MNVQIALFEGRSWVSRAIRWQTRSRFSHAALWLSETREVIEAWHISGVRRGSIDEVHTPGTLVRLYDVDWQALNVGALGEHRWLPSECQDRIIEFATNEVGGRYAFRSVFRFMSRRSAEHRPGEWFCSGLVCAAFRSEQIDLLLRIPSEHVSPAVLSYSPLLRFDREFLTKELSE